MLFITMSLTKCSQRWCVSIKLLKHQRICQIKEHWKCSNWRNKKTHIHQHKHHLFYFIIVILFFSIPHEKKNLIWEIWICTKETGDYEIHTTWLLCTLRSTIIMIITHSVNRIWSTFVRKHICNKRFAPQVIVVHVF